MKILSNLDLRQNQLLQAVIENRESAPLSPVVGQIYFNTVEGKFYGYTEANKWVDLSNIYDDSSVQQSINELLQLVNTKADQTDLTELSERVDIAEGNIDSLEDRVTETEAGIVEINREIGDINSQIERIDSEIEGINTEIESVKSDVAGNTSAIEAVAERVTTVENKVSALEEAKNNSNEKIAELESGLADEIARATGEEQRIAGLVDAEANRAKGEEAKIREEFAAADASLKSSLESKISEVSDKLTADKAELEKAISDVDAKADVNKGLIDTLDGKLTQEVNDRQAADAAQDVVIGTKADKSYVDAELAKKAEKVHTHVMADITDLGTVAGLNAGNGAGQVPVLDEHGKLAMSTIPTLAINETKVVNTIQEAMALNQKSGDIVIINPNSAQKAAIVNKFKADQANVAKGFEVLEANLLNDEFAAYLAQGKTTFICVEPEADTFEDRYRPLNSLADTMNRAEIEAELAKKADKTEVSSAIQGVKGYTDAQVQSTKTELNGAINTAKSELEQSISNLDSKVDGVDAKVDANAQEISAIKQAATALETKVDNHIDDAVKHITAEERLSWNSRTKKVVATIGDGVAKEYEVAHNLGSQDVQVTVKEAATGMVVFCDINCSDENKVVVSFGKAPLNDEFKVVIIG